MHIFYPQATLYIGVKLQVIYSNDLFVKIRRKYRFFEKTYTQLDSTVFRF